MISVSVVAVLVDCRPQDNFTFPGQAASNGLDIFYDVLNLIYFLF